VTITPATTAAPTRLETRYCTAITFAILDIMLSRQFCIYLTATLDSNNIDSSMANTLTMMLCIMATVQIKYSNDASIMEV
jgi:hypothetical protein